MKAKGHFLILACLCLGTIVNAQTKDEHAVKYSKTITADELRTHLSVLASDDFEGRETATQGETMAAFYLAGQFALMTLPPVKDGSYFQEFTLEKYKIQGSAFVNGETFSFIHDFTFINAAGKDFRIDELLFCGYGLQSEKYDDYKDMDVKGKSVLVMAGEPVDKKGISRISGKEVTNSAAKDAMAKMKLAGKLEVKYLFIVFDDFEKTITPYKRYLTGTKLRLKESGEKQGNEPLVFVISKPMAEAMMANAKKSLEEAKAKINKRGKPYSITVPASVSINTISTGVEVSSRNVLGYIEGSDLKDELLVLTAHYDHLGIRDSLVFNGADDDGSGTVGLIEIAEAFAEAKKDGFGPRRSILFLPVSGEEKGLLGSKYYTNHPVFPLENTIADLNLDMLGRIDSIHMDAPSYVYLIGNQRLSTDLFSLSKWVAGTYGGPELDFSQNGEGDRQNLLGRSDHYNFAKKDVPVLFYFSGLHEDYHRSTDTVGKIDFQMLEERTRLVFLTAWHLANQDERPGILDENE